MVWNDKRYYSIDYYLKQTFGEKVYRLSLNGGMTCPNRDGTLGSHGCIFCSAAGSGDFAQKNLPIPEQLAAAKSQIQEKRNCRKFIAYFQAYTNTYAPLPVLEHVFFEAASHPDIAALSIATRPDCLGREVLSLLKRLSEIKPVTVELGLQTIHENSAAFVRRGYPLNVYEEAVWALDSAGIDIVTHLILGLPGETLPDMLATVHHVCTLPLSGLKLQLLYVLRGTDLATHFAAHPQAYPLMDFPTYLDALLACLSIIPEDIVIHRLTGDGPKDLLIAPLWSRSKRHVLNTIHQAFSLKDTWQGKYSSS